MHVEGPMEFGRLGWSPSGSSRAGRIWGGQIDVTEAGLVF
jgi:hypothetical protein